ncbi:MAG TPA: hypothetical protein VL225_09980 [Vicinamibacterales bacterium]|nr:hypothetical protein [Vicinamibacterales bacterium]
MTRKTRYFMAGSAAILVAGLCTGLVAYYGGGFPSLSASRSGPAELSYVPANATVVAFANIREIMDSQLRQRLKQVLPQESGQKEFQAETGIDIEQDIDYVVAAMTTPGEGGLPNNANGLVVARGRFNPTQLETFARDHGGVVEDYKGKRLIKISDAHVDVDRQDSTVPQHRGGDHTGMLAFLEPGLVAIGSETAIKSAIDAQLTAQSITSNGDMMELVSDIDRGNNAWAVGRFDALAGQAKLPAEIASRLPAVKTFAVMSHIDGGVSGSFRAEARDDESAENLRQVVQGFLAMGRLTSANDPKATAVLNSLQLSGRGKTVILSFAVPSEVLDMIPLDKLKKGGDGMHEPLLRPELKSWGPKAPKAPKPPTPPTPDR